MPGVVIRCFAPGEKGYGVHRLKDTVDFPVPFDLVERAFGVKLDKRKNYAVIDGILCETCEWSDTCSGCTNTYEELGYMPDRGGGCSECGYTGRSRRRQWVPYCGTWEKD